MDRSKIGQAAGAADVLTPHLSNKRLPNHSSIFTAEARAIMLALEMAQRCSNNHVLFSSVSRHVSPFDRRNFMLHT